jgi:TPR repeat protein
MAESSTVDSIYWLKKASESNNSNAFLQIGIKYLNGDRFEKDIKKALHNFEKAAELGNAAAQSKIGEIFLNKVLNDAEYLETAVNWLTKAIKQGETSALIQLGLLFLFAKSESGEDIDESALKHLILAAEIGPQGSIKSKSDIIKTIIQTFIKFAEQYQFKLIDEVSSNNLDKIQHILCEFEDHNESVILYYESTLTGTGQELILMGTDRIAWSNKIDEFFIKPYSWKGFRVVCEQNFSITFENHKIRVADMSQEPLRKLCRLLEILHQISNTMPIEGFKKTVEKRIISLICSLGFPSKNVTVPFTQILNLCLKEHVSFQEVLDLLTIQLVLTKINNEEITFYTP